MSIIYTNTCLEMLSPLVNCSVGNVSSPGVCPCKLKFPKVMQQHTKGVVGKLIWVLLEEEMLLTFRVCYDW